MADEDGPKVADSFYCHLFQPTMSAARGDLHASPNTAEAASALHVAIFKLRAEECSFKRWVPFIHMGI